MEEATTETPYWYQDAGIDRLVARRGKHLLFFPPGAGKTRVVCDYLTLLAKAEDDEVRVLVVCPLSALITWVRQTRRYIRQVPLDVSVLTGTVIDRWTELAKDTLSKNREKTGSRVKVRIQPMTSFSMTTVRAKDKTPEAQAEAKAATRRRKAFIVRTADRWKGHAMVVDEIHRFKGPTSVGGRLLRTVAPSYPRRIGLTGTFMPQGYEDVWGQLTIVAGKDVFTPYTGRPSWTAFKERYIEVDPWSHMITGYRHTDELEAIIAEHVLSVSEEEARGARPPVTRVQVPFELSQRERSRYEQMRRELALELGDSTSVPPSAMTLSLRLRQLASGFVGMDDGTITQTGTSRRDATYDLVSGTLGSEKRLLVFGEFLHNVVGFADRLRKDRGTTVYLVTGQTPVAEREQMLARFFDQTDDRRMVVVAQVATLGESVNELDTARHGVMLEPMWDRGKWVQAIGRLGRGVHHDPVTWWCMEAEDTIDGRVYKAMDEKGRLEGIVAEECRAVREPAPGLVMTDELADALREVFPVMEGDESAWSDGAED